MLKFIPVCMLLISCRNESMINFEKEKKEILELEDEQRTYHFTKNARSFTDLFSDHFLSISKGVVDSPSREKSFEKFDNYFKKSKMIKWDEVKQPVIRFSDDGSIAYVAVQR